MVARYGLDEIYRPPGNNKIIANIIFIHGLFGSPQKTWTGKLVRSRSHQTGNGIGNDKDVNRPGLSENGKRTEHDASGDAMPARSKYVPVFWPSALLPGDLPDTRIYTWGYDADIDDFGSSASQNTVHQHAINLLSDLTDLQETNKDSTPFIFVVHCLGGIIVKDALNQSSQTEGTRLKEIAPATYSICFLGTPHRGFKLAFIDKVAYSVSVAATRRPNFKLLQALERNPETLDRVGDAFRQTLLKQNIQVYSFREEKETRKYLIFSTIVVNADSAKIGDSREEVSSIPANHSDMTKFSRASDIGFKRVSAQLRRWVEEIRIPDQRRYAATSVASISDRNFPRTIIADSNFPYGDAPISHMVMRTIPSRRSVGGVETIEATASLTQPRENQGSSESHHTAYINPLRRTE